MSQESRPDVTGILPGCHRISARIRREGWPDGAGILNLSGSLDPASEKFKQFQQKVEDFGRRVGQKFEQMYQRIKRIFGDISNTPGFNDMSWSEKISLALDKILEAVTGWLEGPGGETMSKTGKILGTLLAAGLRGAIPNFVPLGWELAKALAKGIWEGVTSDPLLTTIFGAYLGFKIGGPWGALIGGGGGLLFSLLRRATNQITEGTTNSLPPQNKVFYNEAIKRASGGIFSRPHLALVAEAGPEAIIPLSERMTFRALDLWMQVGRMLGVNQYYVQTGRMIGTRQYNEGGYASRLPVAAPITLGFKPAAVTTGPVNVTFNVYASDGQNVLQVIRANCKVIADEVAWVIANALPSTFQNMPNS